MGNGVKWYLEKNVGTHGFAVSDDWFFIGTFAVPTIQFDAPVTFNSILKNISTKLKFNQVQVRLGPPQLI